MTFIVYALPRSRTAWLSRFLSYGGWHCGHDELRYARSVDDIKSWLSQPLTGTAETGAGYFWRTAHKYAPDARVVVIRRPVGDVVNSLMGVGLPFDRAALTREMTKLDRKLDQIEERVTNISVPYDALGDEHACASVFEHCLGITHDHDWWAHMAPLNVQCDMHARARYYAAYRPQMDKLAAQVKCLTLADFMAKPARDPDGITFLEEPLEVVLRDAKGLMQEHCSLVGQTPDSVLSKDWTLMGNMETTGNHQIITARCNGRVFGYLMSVISPSMDHPDHIMACHHIFHASPLFPGLGRKLIRAANDALEAKGVDDVVMRAGIHGDGPRLGTVYRRMGAEDFGHLYKIKLKKD